MAKLTKAYMAKEAKEMPKMKMTKKEMVHEKKESKTHEKKEHVFTPTKRKLYKVLTK